VADVFLSYARADAATAERIANELRKAGWSVWYDCEVPAHRPFADVIATELDNAAAVIVLWSKAAAASEWVRSEANRARELHKLVQVRLDEVRLPMPFDQIQCADLHAWRAGKPDAGWMQVCASIQALTGVQESLSPTQKDNRRAFLITGAAAASVAVAGGVWFAGHKGSKEHLSPEAALLIQKGTDALQNNDVFAADDAGSLANAVALLSEATRIAP
jgi:hypothetical protein